MYSLVNNIGRNIKSADPSPAFPGFPSFFDGIPVTRNRLAGTILLVFSINLPAVYLPYRYRKSTDPVPLFRLFLKGLWSGDSFFSPAGNRDDVTEEYDLQKQFPDILQVREIIGIYEVRVKDVEVPLKVKVVRVGAQYYGIASLAVREKGAKDHVRDLSGYPSKEAALHGAVNGFFSHLSPGASIKEIKNWGI
jgi:hypothetical protein